MAGPTSRDGNVPSEVRCLVTHGEALFEWSRIGCLPSGNIGGPIGLLVKSTSMLYYRIARRAIRSYTG